VLGNTLRTQALEFRRVSSTSRYREIQSIHEPYLGKAVGGAHQNGQSRVDGTSNNRFQSRTRRGFIPLVVYNELPTLVDNRLWLECTGAVGTGNMRYNAPRSRFPGPNGNRGVDPLDNLDSGHTQNCVVYNASHLRSATELGALTARDLNGYRLHQPNQL
jgi:hypothetical protein